MRFLFLNQYAPPDSPPTARLLGDLAAYLRARGHEVVIVSQRETYRGRPARGRGRLRRELQALLTIAGRGLFSGGPKPDVILTLSSPPGLLVLAAVLARWHRARLAHWAMDLYPELALALGEIGPGFVFRLTRRAMRWAYGQAGLLIALDADMHARLPSPPGGRRIEALAPWAPVAVAPAVRGGTLTPPAGAPWTWLYSGNLGRAHEWKTLLDAQHLLETRGCPVGLVFQGDGAARGEARAYADALRLARCAWIDYAPAAALVQTLLAAQVLVVTQRPETRGLLWPSKLALLEQMDRPILYIGCPDGAIGRRLRARGNAGIFAPGEAEAIASWVESWFAGTARWSACPAVTGGSREEGCRQLENWLLETGRR
jgi:colanic acid biosynthesis glycosyl transferase WcaI